MALRSSRVWPAPDRTVRYLRADKAFHAFLSVLDDPSIAEPLRADVWFDALQLAYGRKRNAHIHVKLRNREDVDDRLVSGHAE